MVDLAALAVILPLLVLALFVAAGKPGTSTEATVSVLGAAFAVLIGAIGGGPATDEVADVGPVLVLFCLLLVLGHLADAEGVFGWATRSLAHGAGESPVVLLRRLTMLAAVTTAVLSTNATVVLLMPLALTAVLRRGHSLTPYAVACNQLANSGSLLLPVGSLTNLLAFTAAGVSFLHFSALMALPWLAAVLAEYALLRRVFAADLREPGSGPAAEVGPAPRLALVVLALTVVGFAVSSALGSSALWPAVAGVLALAVRRLIAGTSTLTDILESAKLSFALFVLGMAVLVRGILEHGLGKLVAYILPNGTSLAALLATAAVAALITNLVTNLPATLLLVPAAAVAGTPAVLAVLIGVNVGSNLSYVGSLTNLVWRRALSPYGEVPTARRFSTVGLLTVPVTLVATTTALWISVQAYG